MIFYFLDRYLDIMEHISLAVTGSKNMEFAVNSGVATAAKGLPQKCFLSSFSAHIIKYFETFEQ